MACPTCGHTMQAVTDQSLKRRVFWCPRCGTIRILRLSADKTFDDVPKIVERAKIYLGLDQKLIGGNSQTFEQHIRDLEECLPKGGDV